MTVKEYNLAVDKFSDGLYRFMLKKSGDSDVAKDLVQTCYERVWIKRDNVPYEKAKSYLFSTAFNAFIDHTRKESKLTEFDADSHLTGSSSQQSADLNEVLTEALGKLPDIQKSVLLLRDYEGYDYKEIGEITNLSESQVKVYIFRARKAMKNYLVSIDYVI